MNLIKFSEKNMKNLPKTGKIAKIFDAFDLMRQSELKVGANKQF